MNRLFRALSVRSRWRDDARRSGGGALRAVRGRRRRLPARARVRAAAAGRARARGQAAGALPRLLRRDRPGTRHTTL